MHKTFKIIYFSNLLIILIGIASPIIDWLVKEGPHNFELQYYSVLIILAFTFSLTFLIVNIYGTIKYVKYRKHFLIVSIIMFVWSFGGVYQAVYLYTHNISP